MDDDEYIVDVTCSYVITPKQLKKVYPEFNTLSDLEKAGLAEEYVKTKVFKTQHLRFVCVDYPSD